MDEYLELETHLVAAAILIYSSYRSSSASFIFLSNKVFKVFQIKENNIIFIMNWNRLNVFSVIFNVFGKQILNITKHLELQSFTEQILKRIFCFFMFLELIYSIKDQNFYNFILKYFFSALTRNEYNVLQSHG